MSKSAVTRLRCREADPSRRISHVGAVLLSHVADCKKLKQNNFKNVFKRYAIKTNWIAGRGKSHYAICMNTEESLIEAVFLSINLPINQ